MLTILAVFQPFLAIFRERQPETIYILNKLKYWENLFIAILVYKASLAAFNTAVNHFLSTANNTV